MTNKPTRTISDYSIFSGYKKPEDALTAALLQVMNYGGYELITSLFGDLFDIPSYEAQIVPQVYYGESHPDGGIICNCSYQILIESKIKPNDINQSQLDNHCKLVNPNNAQFFVYITPDADKPNEIDKKLGLVEWMSWDTVAGILSDYSDSITDEIVRFLIAQLLKLIKNLVKKAKRGRPKTKVDENEPKWDGEVENLYLPSPDETVIIVGGSWGERIALNYGFYACQPNRFFHKARYLAFYHHHRIKELFEIVEQPIEKIDIQKSSVVPADYFAQEEPNYTHDPRKLFKLKHLRTFDPVIENDKTDCNGKPCAFTQRQTYTTYDKIIKAKKTSEL